MKLLFGLYPHSMEQVPLGVLSCGLWDVGAGVPLQGACQHVRRSQASRGSPDRWSPEGCGGGGGV